MDYDHFRIQNANRNISWLFQRQIMSTNTEQPPPSKRAVVLRVPFSLRKSSLKMVPVEGGGSYDISFLVDAKKRCIVELHLCATFSYDARTRMYQLWSKLGRDFPGPTMTPDET